MLAHAWHAGRPGAADGPCVGGAGHGRVAGRPGLVRQRAGDGLLLAGRERLLGSRRASRDRHRVLPQVATLAEPGQGGAQAGGEDYRGQPEGDGGQGDRRAGGPGQRGSQPGGHRPGQGQPAEQPVSAVAVASRRGLPGRDRLHRTQPPGPQRRPSRGQAGQREHSERDADVDPQRDGHIEVEQRVAPVDQRQHPPVTQRGAGDGAGQGGQADLGQVGDGDLGRGEADGFEHADPPVAGHHRRGDHAGGDQHGQHQADDRERDHERRVDPLRGGDQAVRGQPGHPAVHRPGRQRGLECGQVRADLGGGAGAGEGVEHLLLGGRTRRAQRGHLAGGHPGRLVQRDRRGEPDHRQFRPARRAGHGDRAADRHRERRQMAVEVDLAGTGGPPALLQREVIQRAGRRRAARHGQPHVRRHPDRVHLAVRERPSRRLPAGWRPPGGVSGGELDVGLRVGTGLLSHPRQLAGLRQLRAGDLRRADGDGQLGAVRAGERGQEQLVGVGDQGQPQQGRGRAGGQDQEDHCRLHGPPGHSGRGRLQHRPTGHGRAPAPGRPPVPAGPPALSVSLAT